MAVYFQCCEETCPNCVFSKSQASLMCDVFSWPHFIFAILIITRNVLWPVSSSISNFTHPCLLVQCKHYFQCTTDRLKYVHLYRTYFVLWLFEKPIVFNSFYGSKTPVRTFHHKLWRSDHEIIIGLKVLMKHCIHN